MKQKIRLAPNGVVVPGRMQPFTPGAAQKNPPIGLSRLQKLLKTNKPHICLVRGEGLGDVIMTTPIIIALKEMFNEVDISYATNTRYLDGALVKALMYNPDIIEVIEREVMDPAYYDLVINLHCPAIHHEKPKAEPINRIDLFARHAGTHLQDSKPRYYIQKEEVDSGKKKIQKFYHNKIILVQPFASNKRRSLDHRKLKNSLITLNKQYGTKSIIITHSGDFRTEVLWNNVPGSLCLNNADIREIASVMVHCDLVLCPDSSILHLAGALEVPTVGLFGPTDPRARVNHYKNAIAIWEGANFAPCPCWYSACPIKEACWARTTEEKIVKTCIEHLNNTKRININELLDQNKKVEIQTEII